MGIMYLLTVLILIILWMLLKKSDKKLNGIIWGVIAIVLLLCYNIFVCYVLNTIRVTITLLSLSIVNILFSIIITIYLIRKKEVQKYYIEKIDILYGILMICICLYISNQQFGTYPFFIKYQTIDPSRHCLNAIKFAEEDKLLRNDQAWKVERPGAYINTGIAMKMFINLIDEIDLYNVFIAYDIFILCLTSLSMYIIMKRISKNRFLDFVAFLFSVLYVLGYPLNSMVFGFSYLSLSIPIINVIIMMMEIFEEKDIDIKQWTIAVFLLNFSVFFSYYLFVPFIYGAEFIYFNIKSYRDNGKIFTKKNVILIIITLIIPTIISLIFFNFGIQVQDKGSGIAMNMNLYGYAYVNKYSDMLLLIPISIYALIKERKNNKFTTSMFILLLGYILLMYIANYLHLITIYFIMKNYYIAWGLLYYLTYKGITYLHKKNKYISAITTVIYVFLVINTYMYFQEIYIANTIMITAQYLDSKTVYTQEEVQFLKETREMVDFSKNVQVLGDEKRILWSNTLIRYQKSENYKQMTTEEIIKEYENVDYIICFKRDEELNKYEEEIYNNRIRVYESDEGIILKK